MNDFPNPARYDNMTYRRCGNSGLKLPLLSLGLWHNFGDTNTLERMNAICQTAFDHGITHFDLANNYGPPAGAAEKNFGIILKTTFAGHRDELIISTKAGFDMWPGPYGDCGSRKYLLASLDQSLQRLGLDYVDIFYHHRPDPNTPLEETMGALAQAVQSGKSIICRPFQLFRCRNGTCSGDSERTSLSVYHQPEPLFHFRPKRRRKCHSGSERSIAKGCDCL